MGKWADALAAHLADEKLRHPPMGAPSKPSKGGFEPFEGEGVGVCRDFSSPIANAANDPTRTCRSCTNRLRYGTCREPRAAGLLDGGEPFGIRWGARGRAATCRAFIAKPLVKAPDRPHKLTPAEGDAAHAVAWDDGVIARFVARVSRFLRLGFSGADADDLAERLHLRDVQGDDRLICVECRHLAGRAGAWRCGNHQAAGVGIDLPAEMVTTMKRCAGFQSKG